MKKILFLFLVTALVFPVSSFARENAKPSIRQEQERQNTNLENKRTKAQASAKRLRQGLTNRYDNLLKQKAKIEARITKIGTTRDLTLAKAKLATFDDGKYLTDLAAFDKKVAEVLASATPLKLTPELKTLAKVVDTDIKDLRKILADTLRLIIKSR